MEVYPPNNVWHCIFGEQTDTNNKKYRQKKNEQTNCIERMPNQQLRTEKFNYVSRIGYNYNVNSRIAIRF